jgi:2-polyprenyl-3-methyl-5-hydroxy-6-metoxy-1,4-benzoquinol methylase
VKKNKEWYEALFENYAGKYEKECFAQGTKGECDFIEKEIGRDKTIKILDIGCGTGRHAIELAKRGYNVTGVDLSGNMLAKAKKKAAAAGIKIRFIKKDARKLGFKRSFDLVIMLCEGAFPLMETDEMNYRILKNAAAALKKRGRIIFTTLNGLFPLFNSIEKFCGANTKKGNARYSKNRFDLMTFRDHNVTRLVDDSGKKVALKSNERYYVPSEITWLLKSLGFTDVGIFGARLGKFSRKHPLRKDDFEMLVTARLL